MPDAEKKPKLGVQTPQVVPMPDENGHAILYSIKADHDDVMWYRAVHARTKVQVDGNMVRPGVMSCELCRGEPGKARLLARLVVAVDEFETKPRIDTNRGVTRR